MRVKETQVFFTAPIGSGFSRITPRLEESLLLDSFGKKYLDIPRALAVIKAEAKNAEAKDAETETGSVHFSTVHFSS
jgi:hypothetical protein